MSKLCYSSFYKILYKYHCNDLDNKAFSVMLLKSAEIEPSRSYAEDLDEGVLSKFRTGDMQIYERILLDYKKSDILSRIKPYFEKNVTHYILSDQIYDLKEELKNIIEAYKDVRFDTKSSG